MKTLAFALLAVAAPVSADNALSLQRVPNKARALAEQGSAFHQARDYDAAIAAFKEAYVLAPSAGLLFNIAQSYRLAGDCDNASWMYRRFLDTNPLDDQRRLAEQHLATVDKCMTGSLNATVVPPKLDLSIPEPQVKRTYAPIDQPGHKLKHLGISVGIGGGVMLATAAVFAFDAHEADSLELGTRNKRSTAIATTLGITGSAAVASGVALFALGRHYEQAQRIAVTPMTQGAQVRLTWAF